MYQGDSSHLGLVRRRFSTTAHRQDNTAQSGDDRYDDHQPGMA
jgi:hypothetical protein